MWKSIRESINPPGLDYIYPCGHEIFVPVANLLTFSKPETCPECEDKPEEKIFEQLNNSFKE